MPRTVPFEFSVTFYTRLSLCGPVLDSTRCGFSHLRAVLLACILKACKGSICCVGSCKELECSGRMALRWLRAPLNACCNTGLCQSFICCTDMRAGSHLVVNLHQKKDHLKKPKLRSLSWSHRRFCEGLFVPHSPFLTPVPFMSKKQALQLGIYVICQNTFLGKSCE